MNTDSRTHYQAQAVETAGPAQLVLMLYDGVLAALTRAEQALDSAAAGELELAGRELLKAQDILDELTCTLDHAQGGSVAANLAALYDFCIDQLVTANLHKDPTGLGGVRAVVVGLRDAWAAACCHAPGPVAWTP